ncbi:MAG: phage terminase large subunit [Alphaproteobacteria bacterium]|nr:phage terminase large subunit [Alphaproteobacteria bacterium]
MNIAEHYLKKTNKKFKNKYGFEIFSNIVNYEKEKQILINSLSDCFAPIAKIFDDVYFSDKYNSLLFSTGRGTGKSTRAIRTALYHIVFKQTDVLSFKEFDNSSRQSVQEFADEIYKLGIDKLFRIMDTEIRCVLNTNRIMFKGVKEIKSSFSANITAKNKLKTFGNVGLLILDEGNSISYSILDVLITSMRNKYKEQVKVFVLFNPYSKESPVETYFQHRKSCLVSKNEINISMLPEKYRDVSLWTEYCEDKEGVANGKLNEKVFNQKWYGIPNDVENGLVFSQLEEFTDLQKLQGCKTVFAIDPAFGGGDTCAMSIISQVGTNSFIFTGFSWQESIEQAIPEIEYILKTLGVKEGFMEGNNLSQEWLSNHLNGFNLTVDKPTLNKNYRITQSLYTYMSYYNLSIPYNYGSYKKQLNSSLFVGNLFNYVANSNKNDNEADAITYGIYYLKGLKI